MALARISTAFHAARLNLRIRQARRREREALARLGEMVADGGEAGTGDVGAATRSEIRRIRLQRDSLTQALARSLDADRADYAVVSRYLRPMVVLRGLCDRGILHHHLQRCRRELHPLYQELGEAVMAEVPHTVARVRVSAPLGDAVRAARRAGEAAATERASRLAPFGGATLAPWTGHLAQESRTLGGAVTKQLRSQLLPRASALGGLAAGWWVANTYTDSHWRSALRSVGIGQGGTHVVSAETYRTMSLLLPILSAAVCAYLCDRLAFGLRRRYQRQDPSPAGDSGAG